MVRELRRLLIPRHRLEAAAIASGAAVDGGAPLPDLPLQPEESRYLTRVLRYRPGDAFAVVDGEGRLWSARLQSPALARLDQPLPSPLQRCAAPQPRLVLAAAVVKRDFEVVVRMAVELGVDRLIPLLSERTAVLGQLRPDRWRSIAAEAAEQCERLWLPRVDDPRPLVEVLQEAGESDRRLYWATTRQRDVMPLGNRLAEDDPEAVRELWLACGPEGGWSDAEEDLARRLGAHPVGLGSAILRSSTAAVAGLVLLSGRRDALAAAPPVNS